MACRNSTLLFTTTCGAEIPAGTTVNLTDDCDDGVSAQGFRSVLITASCPCSNDSDITLTLSVSDSSSGCDCTTELFTLSPGQSARCVKTVNSGDITLTATADGVSGDNTLNCAVYGAQSCCS